MHSKCNIHSCMSLSYLLFEGANVDSSKYLILAGTFVWSSVSSVATLGWLPVFCLGLVRFHSTMTIFRLCM